SPSSIVERVNHHLTQSIEIGKFVTFFFAALDPATLRLEYVNAGHPAPLLLRAGGTIEQLTAGGVILGVDEGAHFDSGVVDLAPGDVLALFTDGVTEAMNADDHLYGEERVAALVRRSHD